MALDGTWGLLVAVWIVSSGILALYWFGIVLPLLWHRPASGDFRGRVSVVVCIHELTPQFGALLASLSRQDYPMYEVVIVNDGGQDEISAALAGHQVREIRHTPEQKRPGKKQALEAGIEAARGPWVLLTDADCRVGHHWISSMMRCVSQGITVVLGYGPLTRTGGLVNMLARFDNLVVALQYLGWARWGRPYMGVGRNLGYRRDLFLGGEAFAGHADLSSGDDDLFIQAVARKENTAICLDPASFAWSPAKNGLGALLHQKRRHVSTGPRYARTDQFRLALFAISWIVWWSAGLLIACFAPSQSFLMVAIGIGLLQWVAFAFLAHRLEVRELTLWFVPLSLLYALFLVVQGVLMLIGPPKQWKRS